MFEQYSLADTRIDNLIKEASKQGVTFSEYNLGVFKEVVSGRGNVLVDAVPGSGKTFTLKWASKLIKSESALAVTFNKHMKDDLKASMPNIECQTLNALGFKYLWSNNRGNFDIDAFKYNRLVKMVISSTYPHMANRSSNTGRIYLDDDGKVLAGALFELVNKSRVQLNYNYHELQHRYFIDGIFPDDYNLVDKVLIAGLEEYRDIKRIDFTDQVWVPSVTDDDVHKIGGRNLHFGNGLFLRQKYQWILADESQDLSPATLQLILKACSGRVLFVGDKNQAILGFAGADTNSMEVIRTTTKATEAPLNICYRCPTSHVKLAKELNPDIEASPTAINGEIFNIFEEDLDGYVEEGDLILCRTTAPLIKHCLQSIKMGLPAKIRGRDISKQLIRFMLQVKNYQPSQRNNFDAFRVSLQSYYQQQVSRLSQDEFPDEKLQELADKYESLLAIYDFSYGVKTYDEFRSTINNLFDDKRSSIWFSTVHRAKGLEASRVFLLYAEEFPYTRPKQTEEQFKQEQNLLYVALTRSKHTLFMVAKNNNL